ncbi:MAG: hypothetical protein EOO88_04005 [Pedobacter sp.]|nr:MAG: hypothetical protein EOO88_04005 [Pedobacter sp.]
MKRYILICICFISTAVQAQFVAKSKRAADVYFQHKEYYAAAEYYKKSLQLSTDSGGFVAPYGFDKKIKEESPKRAEYEYSVYQLAHSLRLYKNFKDAEGWYAIAQDFPEPQYIQASYYYGETLMTNQRFTEAITAFRNYLAKTKTNDEFAANARRFIASCSFALYEMSYPRLYQLTRLSNAVNGLGSNYTPYLTNGIFYFTSSRPVNVSGKDEVLANQKDEKVIKKESPYVNSVYEVKGDLLSNQVSLRRIEFDPKDKESAAPAIHPNGRLMYVTRWSKGTRNIYEVTATGDDKNKVWSTSQGLVTNINVNGYNSMQPFISKDGKYLVFSSDRPGGQGKYDLWYCQIRKDGTLGLATNLGPKINTKEDEEAPYYNSTTKRLMYSSAGKIGLGGLDFYETNGDFGTWTEPQNMGYPFNSSKDDVYFTPTDDMDATGYISSDRQSVCCLEVFHIKRDYLNVHGKLLDCKTNKPLQGATVTLTDSTGQYKAITDAQGIYKLNINTNRKVKLLAEMPEYFSKVINFGYETLSKSDTLFNSELCLVPFKVDKPIVLKDIYYEFNSAELNDASKATLDQLFTIMSDNESIEIELSAHTDNIGTAEYNLDLSEKRAKACVDYLIARGISPSKMVSKGYGFSKPIAPNQLPDGKDNPEGRQMNRRTEFKVTKK